MTVQELITQLQALPPRQKVVVDLHSDWAEVTQIEVVEGYEHGGYVSAVYSDGRGRDRACNWVLLS